MTFMIAAYVVFWLVTFLFAFSIYSRQRSLRREVELMGQLLESQEEQG